MIPSTNLTVVPRLLAVVAMLAAVLVPRNVRADGVPPLAAQEQFSSFNGNDLSLGLGTLSQSITAGAPNFNTYMGSATSSIIGGVDPSVQASASVTGSDLSTIEVGSSAAESYYLMASGPSGSVPLIIASNVLANVTECCIVDGVSEGSAASSGYIRIFYDNDATMMIDELVNGGAGANYFVQTSSFVAPDITIPANTLITVDIGASAEAYSAGDSAFANVDPIISIDPSFAGASNYSLEFSAGIKGSSTSGPGSGSTVPEPSSFWLMTVGLLALVVCVKSGLLSA